MTDKARVRSRGVLLDPPRIQMSYGTHSNLIYLNWNHTPTSRQSDIMATDLRSHLWAWHWDLDVRNMSKGQLGRLHMLTHALKTTLSDKAAQAIYEIVRVGR